MVFSNKNINKCSKSKEIQEQIWITCEIKEKIYVIFVVDMKITNGKTKDKNILFSVKLFWKTNKNGKFYQK